MSTLKTLAIKLEVVSVPSADIMLLIHIFLFPRPCTLLGVLVPSPCHTCQQPLPHPSCSWQKQSLAWWRRPGNPSGTGQSGQTTGPVSV